MKGSVKLPVFIDDARKLVNTTQLRAKYLGATYEAEYCQWQALHGLGSLMETASLIITPNAYLEGKLLASYPPDPIGDFDVTRATTATRVNSAGLVELVPYNLVQYSEDLTNAIWTPLNEVTITANASIAPNGTTTADRLQGTGSSWFFAQQKALTSGVSHTISAYVKSNTGSSQTFRLFGCGSLVSSDFTATTQWQRFEFTFTSTTDITHGIARNSSNATADLLVWGAQINEGTLKPYQKTETRLNIPRLDYSNGTCPSLLVEPQRTNVFLNSSSFSSAGWLNTNSTITSNTTSSPSGVQDADTIGFGSGGYVGQFFTHSGVYSFSIYAKYIGTQWLYLQNYNGGDYGAWFDIQNGTIGTIESGVTASIEQAENGFYRCTITYNASNSNASYYVFFNTTGNGSYARTGSSYFWGAQLELGSYPTSYIPTTSASVTRNADVISKTGISSLIGQTEGTMFAEIDFDSNIGGTKIIKGLASNGSNFIYFFISGSTLVLSVVNGGSFEAYITYSLPTNGKYKIAAAYKNNDFVMYANGTQVASATSGSVPTTSILYLGNDFLSVPNKIEFDASALWKTRLTNTQLAALTTI